jgi:hypothetical protein
MRGTPDLNADPWIKEHSLLSPDKLHAIGVIAFRWNRCEFGLLHLLSEMVGLPHHELWALVHDLGDVSICARVRTFTSFRDYPPIGAEFIDNCLQVYDLCRQNRNAVIHAWTVSAFEPGLELKLARRSKQPHDPYPTPFASATLELRRVAEEIELLDGRIWLLTALIETRELGTPPASLEILPLPELLSTPPRREPIKPPRPRRSSHR